MREISLLFLFLFKIIIMQLKIVRTYRLQETTGELLINGSHFCYTLEDIMPSGVGLFGERCIPEGNYEVVYDYSPHFKKDMPHIKDVPGSVTLFGGKHLNDCGIRIHGGNTRFDTEGCPLICYNIVIGKAHPTIKGVLNYIFGSASDKFNELIRDTIVSKKERVFITITSALEHHLTVAYE